MSASMTWWPSAAVVSYPWGVEDSTGKTQKVEHVCAGCGRVFLAYASQGRKHCSLGCTHRPNEGRDEKILAEYEAGNMAAEIARKHGLSRNRVGQVIGQELRRGELRTYQACAALLQALGREVVPSQQNRYRLARMRGTQGEP